MTSRIIWSTARRAILLTVIYSTIINGFPIIRQSSNKNSTPHEAYDVASYSNKSINHYRIRRELDDSFRTAVTRMQMMSRVINGIALQQSITKGTVETDTLIMELLNFGSTTPDYIENIPLDTLDSVVKEVTGLGEKLKADDGITRMENRMLLISSISKTSENIEKLETPNNTYIDEVNTWLTSKIAQINWSSLEVLLEAFIGFINNIDKLEQTVPAKEITKVFFPVRDLAGKLKTEKIDAYGDILKSDILRRPEDHFNALMAFHASVKKFSDNFQSLLYTDTIDDPILKTIGEQMDSLAAAIVNINSNLPTFETLNQFLTFRQHISGNRDLKETSGFPSGSADIGAISIALDDSWVQLAVDIQQIPLAKSMEQLSTVLTCTKAIDNAFGQKGSQLVGEITSTLLDFTQYAFKFDDVASKLSDIQRDASSTNLLPKSRVNFDTLYAAILSTAAQLKAADEIIAVAVSFKTRSTTELEELSKLGDGLTTDELPAELEKVRKTQIYLDLVKAANELKPHLSSFDGSSIAINTMLQNIGKDYAIVVKDYIDESSGFLTMLQNLHNIPELKLVDDAIGALRKCRGVSIESFDPVATEINDVRTKIKDFKQKIREMKDAGNPEAQMLVQESDVSKDSEVIGSATRVFSGIKSLLESDGIVIVDQTAKPTIENFLNSGPMDPKDQQNLQHLLQLDGELNKLSTTLKTLQLNPVIAATDANLSSFAPVYNLAGNINGLQSDFLGMAGSVEKLAQGNQELLKVKQQLELLDGMGLNFAKHHAAITGTQQSLEAMDLFFASVNAKFTPNSTTQPPEPKAPAGDEPASRDDKDDKAEESANEAEKYKNMLSIVILSAAVVLVVVAVSIPVGIKGYNEYSKLPKFSTIPFDTFQIYVKDTLLQPVIYAKETSSNYNGAFNFKIYYTHGLFSKYNREHYTVDVSPSVTNMVGNHRLTLPDGQIKPVPQPLGKNDRIVVKDAKRFPVNYYHGNMLTCPNKTKIAMMQAPVVANNKLGLNENVGLFFQAALEHKSELIVCLVPFGGDGCDRYIPENEGDTDEFMKGQLKITCTNVQTECDGKLVIRSLDVKFQGKKVYRTTHGQVLGWRSQNIPTSVDAQVEIMRMMEKTNKPIFMHCMDGLGQTGAMALAFMCKQGLVEDEGRLQYGENMRLIRASRVNAVTLPEHTLCAFLISYKFIRSDISDAEIAAKKDIQDDVAGIEDLIKMILDGVLDEYDLANWGQVIQPNKTPAPPIIDPNSNPVPNANPDLPPVVQMPPPCPVVVPPPVKNMDKVKGKVPGNFLVPIDKEFNRLRKERDDAEKMLPPRRREEKRKRKTDLGDDPKLAAKKTNGKK